MGEPVELLQGLSMVMGSCSAFSRFPAIVWRFHRARFTRHSIAWSIRVGLKASGASLRTTERLSFIA